MAVILAITSAVLHTRLEKLKRKFTYLGSHSTEMVLLETSNAASWVLKPLVNNCVETVIAGNAGTSALGVNYWLFCGRRIFAV